MRILSVSDRVAADFDAAFEHRRIGPIDLVLSCGDLPPEYLGALADRFAVPLYYVRGNHDIRLADTIPPGCTNLNEKLIRFRGITLLGLEGSRWYNGGLFQYTDSQMRWKLLALTPKIWLQRGIDIVITHAPPRHIHDADDRCHRGFKSFRRLIDRHRPRYLVHGHIHTEFSDPSDRTTIVNRTKVINTYGYYVFEIEA